MFGNLGESFVLGRLDSQVLETFKKDFDKLKVIERSVKATSKGFSKSMGYILGTFVDTIRVINNLLTRMFQNIENSLPRDGFGNVLAAISGAVEDSVTGLLKYIAEGIVSVSLTVLKDESHFRSGLNKIDTVSKSMERAMQTDGLPSQEEMSQTTTGFLDKIKSMMSVIRDFFVDVGDLSSKLDINLDSMKNFSDLENSIKKSTGAKFDLDLDELIDASSVKATVKDGANVNATSTLPRDCLMQ